MKNTYLKLVNTFILGVLIVLSSCDDKTIDELNSAPIIEIFQNDGNKVSVEDSVKISLKSSKDEITYKIFVSDEENNIDEINFEIISGRIESRYNSELVSSILYEETNKDSYEITFKPLDLGTNIIRVIVTDNTGSQSYVEIKMHAFINFSPIAILDVNKTNVLNIENHYTMVAEKSFDQDKNYGGGIDLYEYTIDGEKINTKSTSISQVFGIGDHTVKLRVKDLDGDFSEFVENNITVN